MARTHILGLLMLVAARGVAADGATTSTAAAAAPAIARSADQSTPSSRQQPASRTPVDRKRDSAPAGGAATQSGDVKMSGMSILGNEDAPKSLALVPWKSSQLGDMPSVSRLLDSAAQPVDKEVFMRELAYYAFKSRSN